MGVVKTTPRPKADGWNDTDETPALHEGSIARTEARLAQKLKAGEISQAEYDRIVACPPGTGWRSLLMLLLSVMGWGV